MITLLILLMLSSMDIGELPYKDARMVNSTVFSSQDEFNPDPKLACTNKQLKDKDLVIAHRTLPCGTKVVICSLKGLCTKATVLDRGPYGLSKDCKNCDIYHTASIDISFGVRDKIKHSGFEQVMLFSPVPIEDKIVKVKGIKIKRNYKDYQRRNS